MSIKIDDIVIQQKQPTRKNVVWYDGKDLKIPYNGKWKTVGGSGGVPIVNTIEELGALDIPLGTVASIAKEEYEGKDYFTNAVKRDNLTLKGIAINDNIIFSDLPKYEMLIQTSEWKIYCSYSGAGNDPAIKRIIFGIRNIDLELCCVYKSGVVKIYYDTIQEANRFIAASSNNDLYFISYIDKFLQGIFSSPSEVQTYVKTEKGLDLPSTIYRNFSDFGAQPELFPKEERVVKNFEIHDSNGYSGGIKFETQGGTRITIITENGWTISYDDSEGISLDDTELQKLKDLINNTTVYYVSRGGSSPFIDTIDSIFSADFPPIYKPVELTTWSKVYTQQDALSDSEIDSIMNEVFGGGGYYYYGDNGIGEFDLDEEQTVEEVETVNVEDDETSS